MSTVGKCTWVLVSLFLTAGLFLSCRSYRLVTTPTPSDVTSAITNTATPTASDLSTVTNTATATATNTPLPTATSTPVPVRSATATPVKQGTEEVVTEVTEEQMAAEFYALAAQGGGTVSDLEVRLTEGKIRVSASKMTMAFYTIEDFEMVGTFRAESGRVRFTLESVSPAVPQASMISVGMDYAMFRLAQDLYVTDVHVVDGKVIITGTKSS